MILKRATLEKDEPKVLAVVVVVVIFAAVLADEAEIRSLLLICAFAF